MFQPRSYRKKMEGNRFSCFHLEYHESDLWIGADPWSYKVEMINFARKIITGLREDLVQYEIRNPGFFRSHAPIQPDNSMPGIIERMCREACKAGVGPMAGVAGAFSEYLGYALMENFHTGELLIENGGDCFLQIAEPATVTIHAGNSALSEKVGLIVPPDFSPVGICTSSGTVGHSFSYGKADAVTVSSRNIIFADAMATSVANRITDKSSIQCMLDEVSNCHEMVSLVLICEDRLGYLGEFEMTCLNE